MKKPPLKILILEDDNTDAEIIQHLLKKNNSSYVYHLVMTKDAYLQALDEFKPDVILSDNALPQFSATEALALLKQHPLLHIPFILVTGTVSEEFAAGIIKAGADDYLLKDRLTRLPVAIAAAVKQKQTEKEKEEAIEKLKESETKYRTIMESVSDAFVAVDKNGNYTYVNQKAANTLNLKPEQMAGKNIWVLFPDAVGLPFYDAFYKVLKEQQYILVENYFPLHDVWLENHIYPSPDGLAIFFNDITARKKAEEMLKASEEKYRLLIERMSDGFIALDKDWRYTYVNYRYGELELRNPQSLIGKNIWEEFPGTAGTVGYEIYHKAMVEQKYMCGIDYYKLLDIWVENHIYPAPEGGIFVFLRDITAGKKAEQKIIKANRLYFFISQINQMIVRTTDAATLFKEVCRIAVELGEFKMAWIGMIDEQDQKVIPVMYAGEERGYLSSVKTITMADIAEGRGPVGSALREGKYIICNDIENDPQMPFWKDAALERGYLSSMSLPIKKFGKVIGSFSVYAAEKDFFDDVEITLLEEAAGDVSFALEVFEKEKQRKEAEETIHLSEEKYIALVNSVDGIVWEADAETFNFNFVSKQAERLLGYPTEQWINEPAFWSNHIYSEDRDWVVEFCVNSTNAKESHEFEYRMVAKNGTIVWLRNIVSVIVENNIPVMLRGIMIDITERKKAEDAVLQSEKRYQTLAEVSPVGIFHTDETGDTTYVNPRWCSIAGLSFEEALGNGWLKAVHPDDKETVMKGWRDATKTGQFSISEHRFVHADGTIAWVIGQAIPERDANNKVVGYVGTTTDITERKKIEESITKSNERFELIASATKDGLWDWNLETGKLWGNEIHQQFYGLTLADRVPNFEEWKKRIHPEDREQILTALENAKASGSKVYVDGYRFYTENGGWINVYGRTLIERNKEGKAIRLIGSMTDITELKKAEEEIKSSEEKRRFIMNAALDAIICMDTKGLITFWNPQAEEIFGWHEAEVMGKRLSEIIIPGEFREMHNNGIENYLNTGEAPVLNKLLELRAINRQKKEFAVELTILPIKQGNEEFFCSFIRDITERKKAEEAIKESEEKYRTLVEQASDGIFIADNTGKFIIVNSSGCKMTGYTIEELKELTIYDLAETKDLAANPFNFEEMHRPQGVSSQRKLLCKNGTVVDVEINAKFLSDKRFIAFVRDISERKKAEEAIKESEEKYRTLVEQASDAIFISDTDGRFVTVNPSACKLSQYTEKELLQMTIFDFFIEEDIEKTPIQFDALKQGKTITSERVMKRKDGGVNHLEITAKILNDGKLLSFVRDISERKKAQEEIIKEKNLSDSIINSLPGIFYLFNKQGKFLRWNTNFEKVSRYSAAEIKEMHPIEFFDDDEKNLLAEKINNVFSFGEDEVMADFFTKTKEKLPYYFTGIAIDYEGERCLLGVGIDFSERAMAQEEIRKTTEKLRELTAHLLSVREEERKRIGREIHDELGQQLTAIKMDVSWIDKKMPEESDLIKNKLRNIITLLDGSNQSIRRILSELRPGILDDYGLIEALEWLNTQFTSTTGITVKFKTSERELKLPEPLGTCIFRVYQEAFTNIARHAGAGKVVSSLTVAKGYITVIIEDDGKGFEAAAAQSKKSFGILGMKERVYAQSGTFEQHSTLGKGSKVIIQLPYSNNKNI